jgi:uncharacterized protein YlxP (DUF503 family)
MFVGVLRLECFLPTCHSLKEKRQLVRSLKDRLRNKFNVAVAETDFLDKWQRAELGVVTVSGENSHLGNMLDEIERYVTMFPAMSVVVKEREVL